MNINALYQSFENIKGSKNGTSSITFKILNDETLQLCYTCVVHYATEQSERSQVAREEQIAKSMLSDAIKIASKEYKEITKEALKTKVVRAFDDHEIISASAHNPRKIAYYKYFMDIAVS